MKKILIIISLLAASLAYAGSYTPNLHMYEPSVGENNWGNTVNVNNWSMLDSILKGVNSQGTSTFTDVSARKLGTAFLASSGKYATLNALVADATANGKSAQMDADLLLASSQTLTVTAILDFSRGGVITCGTGTIVFTVQPIFGNTQAFNCSPGHVTGLTKSNPRLWGYSQTDNSTQINAAFASNGDSPSTIVFDGVYKVTSSPVLANRGKTLTGGGEIRGASLVIGLPNGENGGIDYDFTIDNIRFGYDSITTGKHNIELQYAYSGLITHCTFSNYDKAITVTAHDNFQHVNKLIIDGNRFRAGNYCLYLDHPNGASNIVGTGDVQFINNQAYGGIQRTHVYAVGLDGIIATNNTLFFPGYNELNQSKEYNFYIDTTNIVTIANNHLFESGLESIWVRRFQSLDISHNISYWAGERAERSCIKLSDGSLTGAVWTMSHIAGNECYEPTKYGIEIIGGGTVTTGYIKVDNNLVTTPGSTQVYYGSDGAGNPALVSSPHYAVYADSATTNVYSSNNNTELQTSATYSSIYLGGVYSNLDFGTIKNSGGRTYASKGIVENTLGGGETTIDVTGLDLLNFINSSPVTVTMITNNDYLANRKVTFYGGTANTTIQHNSNCFLKNNASATIPLGGFLTIYQTNLGPWRELSRSWIDKPETVLYTFSTFTISSSTTLSNITSLITDTLSAETAYQFEGELYTNGVDTTGGIKVAVGAYDGIITASDLPFSVKAFDTANVLQPVVGVGSYLGNGQTAVGASNYVITISGKITTVAAGKLAVQFAQKVANGTSTIKAGSWFRIRQTGIN